MCIASETASIIWGKYTEYTGTFAFKALRIKGKKKKLPPCVLSFIMPLKPEGVDKLERKPGTKGGRSELEYGGEEIIRDAGRSWSLCEPSGSLGVGRRGGEEEPEEEGRLGAQGLAWKGRKRNRSGGGEG